mmetsp:Transcript_29687/g.22040  ORF Transcript_29687/g.22040 Transcript_29687/m.22040 type:complete len:209 (+) Transcript_29687:1150-1776(+)|eukprot:CAMPEP_0202980048 /NCGR_PEP_ID=MMETSP1396-20130829/86042_1 /ASSEMBLY_ACC=CAM_ASM_000872 /TAXON_ID= /ORGANISM="Pseudokeronopsis sp., Strain Brazil" /LENGTH=208 /DNA_ID=CAMNT_0049719771 /DNA_START=1149 /DNA_END=1775 /DNA_ORIENTATION=-
MNLFLMGENNVALAFVEKALKISAESSLFKANIFRIQGILLNNKLDFKGAIHALKTAKKIYQEVGSVYGSALVNFSIGYMYISNITELIVKVGEERIHMVAEVFFQNSLKQFKELNHIVGIALSNKQLSHIKSYQKKFNEAKIAIQQYQFHYDLFLKNYNNMQSSVHVKRLNGKDISLMSEQVYDTNHTDLFRKDPSQRQNAILTAFG